MNIFSSLATASLYALLFGILTLAALTVTVRNLFHAAIFLAFTLLGVAGVYFFLRAEFLGGAQILLYVGAIMTLVIFAIMLTAKIADPAVPQTNSQRYAVLGAVVLLGISIVTAIVKVPWNLAQTFKTTNAVEIGKSLMMEFVLPFEIISLVLLVALIGAIVVARSDQ